MKKIKNSLLKKYIVIILVGIVWLPVCFIISSLLFFNVPSLFQLEKEPEFGYTNGSDLEQQWHTEARQLSGASQADIEKRLRELQQAYRGAGVMWVDAAGKKQLQLHISHNYPESWTAAEAIQFMKNTYSADPFTTVAFIGQDPNQGFMVLQVPRDILKEIKAPYWYNYGFVSVLTTLIFVTGFLAVSFIFFYRIRKRMLRLQQAMNRHGDSGIPAPIKVSNQDEIGHLEYAFNEMIDKLQSSRKREQEEEALRRQLVASLSHDLRTPLTTIQGHAYRLGKERLSEQGEASLKLIDAKVAYLGRLIENLFSYTLLSSGKYPFNPARHDIVRLVRGAAANWYPVFEQEGFDFELELAEEPIYARIDPQWMERVLDNLFQNVINHAASGQYIAVTMSAVEQGFELSIADRGPGVESESAGKGAGLGLSIVALMLKDMELEWALESTAEGTRAKIAQRFLNEI
ncbi:histidine kinase dimerization/phospho-acceptor domain-containing protein [Paenibacillus sp. GCM10012307]|uniref:histidine kinase n=1 Tax=Paenibacillus roseus TaxID=2798579 RepID=A0A934J8W9_9BACL|nr:HAMP domain-containing sensor histidine kinase [Paenibacillus roseus]MBJ6363979.1 HAMP domain-containing histidine kinase [Paenibacillus roseus]